MPAYLVLQRGQRFVFNASYLPMLNVSCLSESCFVSCDLDLFIDLFFGYSCIELFVKDKADVRVGVSV